MKQKKDTRFLLTSFFEEQTTKNEVKDFQREIKRNGCMNMTRETDNYTVKVYTSELAVILCSNALHGKSLIKNEESKIEKLNSFEYFNTYVDAYKEGRQYFDQNFAVSANTLYGENCTNFIKDLHQNYFHTQHFPSYEGWQFVKQQYPFLLTHETIMKFGYCSGIVSKVEELIIKHPNQFKDFEKCSVSEPIEINTETPSSINSTKQIQELPQKTKTENKLTINQIALKYAYEGIQITRQNGTEIAKQYGHNSGEKLFQMFTLYSSATNRKGRPIPCTPKKLQNKIELIDSVIELLTPDKQNRAKDEVAILKNILDTEYQ